MKIAFFLSSRNIIPPLKTGGIEQSAYFLIRELTKRGHQITIFSAPGSKVSKAKIKEISPFSVLTKLKHGNLEERISGFYDSLALSDFFLSGQQENFDLIQFGDYLFYKILPFASLSKIPILVEINYPHEEIYPYIKDTLTKIKNVHYLPVSNFIKSIMPGLDYLETVYPSLDFKKFPLSNQKRKHLLFVGRICPEKGPHVAIKTAQVAKQKLIIAGPVKKTDWPYFSAQIKPHLDNKNIFYVGEVDFKAKIKLFQQAKATLFPTLWSEPFGLVPIESMACGTPVIAFDRATAREIIKNNTSGFIIKNDNIETMVKAVKKVDRLARPAIRQWVIDNFSIEKTAEQYEKICERIIKNSKKRDQ